MQKNFRMGMEPRRPVLGLAVLAALLFSSEAMALSEIQQEDVPLPTEEETLGDEIQREQLPPPVQSQPERDVAPPHDTRDMSVPLPDPVVIPQTPPKATATPPEVEDEEPIPAILYDVELLPEPVRRMRARIMEACLTGDVEQLRPLIETGENGTQLSFGSVPGDPVEFLRELSGDDDGQEILAILYEVMAAGFVQLDAGEPGEMYAWPYFLAVPLDALDKRQRVELFKLVTAGDYEDMKNFGAYIFYRVGISPEGRWLFFVAGD